MATGVECQRWPAAAGQDLVEGRVGVVPGIADHVDGIHLVEVVPVGVADHVRIATTARSWTVGEAVGWDRNEDGPRTCSA